MRAHVALATLAWYATAAWAASGTVCKTTYGTTKVASVPTHVQTATATVAVTVTRPLPSTVTVTPPAITLTVPSYATVTSTVTAAAATATGTVTFTSTITQSTTLPPVTQTTTTQATVTQVTTTTRAPRTIARDGNFIPVQSSYPSATYVAQPAHKARHRARAHLESRGSNHAPQRKLSDVTRAISYPQVVNCQTTTTLRSTKTLTATTPAGTMTVPATTVLTTSVATLTSTSTIVPAPVIDIVEVTVTTTVTTLVQSTTTSTLTQTQTFTETAVAGSVSWAACSVDNLANQVNEPNSQIGHIDDLLLPPSWEPQPQVLYTQEPDAVTCCTTCAESIFCGGGFFKLGYCYLLTYGSGAATCLNYGQWQVMPLLATSVTDSTSVVFNGACDIAVSQYTNIPS